MIYFTLLYTPLSPAISVSFSQRPLFVDLSLRGLSGPALSFNCINYLYNALCHRSWSPLRRKFVGRLDPVATTLPLLPFFSHPARRNGLNDGYTLQFWCEVPVAATLVTSCSSAI